MKIVLMGYMASGKSSVGAVLAKTLGLDFIDLDRYIETKENQSIQAIFHSKGEIYFRKQESVFLKEILEKKNGFVLALGGGTPCYGTNNDIIAQATSNTFYLKASIATLSIRLEQEKQTRPIVAQLNSEQLTEYIAKHLFERAPYYERAQHKLIIDNKSIDEIVLEIKKVLN